MRRFAVAATLLGAAGLIFAACAWADVPDCDYSYIDDEPYLLTTTPRDAVKIIARTVTATVVVKDDTDSPIEGYDASNFTFVVQRHSDYPALGCTDCEDLYAVSCVDAATNVDGEMRVLIDLGTGCSPSMCCPVEIFVQFPNCDMSDAIDVLMNSVDLVPSGVVDLSDIANFGTALAAWSSTATPQPCADFVYSPAQTQWGELDLSDIAAFGVEIGANCSPFTDPCE